MFERSTASEDDTETLGVALGRTAPAGALLGLVGDLGAGKTCLVRGLARGLGIDPAVVHSPSFTIVNAYAGGRLPLQHVDLYRLERPLDDELFFRDVLYGEGVAAVEWFDRLFPAAGDDVLVVTLAYGGAGRTLGFDARGVRHQRWLAAALTA